ncbi:MAG: haloacid dehalogenase type II [Sporichthyaceae bacterium]
MTTVIAFDVNETLLDLRALDEPFEQVMGDATLRAQWFALMLQVSFAGGVTGDYVDFTTAQRAAFTMLAERLGIETGPDAAAAMVDRMSSLPAHPEVPDALTELHQTSLQLVALTNSVAEVAEAQLTSAGIREHFDRVVSADGVRRLKPAKEPYAAVADACGTTLDEVRLVAAHWWDIDGALSAGCKGAFVARPGAVLSPVGPRPDIVEPDIAGVVRRILETDL